MVEPFDLDLVEPNPPIKSKRGRKKKDGTPVITQGNPNDSEGQIPKKIKNIKILNVFFISKLLLIFYFWFDSLYCNKMLLWCFSFTILSIHVIIFGYDQL